MSKIARYFFLLGTLVDFSLLRVRSKRREANMQLIKNFLKLGGVYTKFLQMSVLRQNIDSYNHKELQDILAVFDDARPEPIIIRQTLRKELGDAALQEFSTIEETPFATGSFGQVYGATLLTGEQVVIKVLRPHVVQNLSFDLKLLSLAARVIDLFKAKDFLKSSDLFHEMKETMLRETDYQLELQTAQAMYEEYKDHPNIVVPKSFPKLSNKHLLVQERITGMPLSELMQHRGDREQYVWQHLRTDLSFIMEEIAFQSLNANFDGRVSHGDPHPGNFILLPHNRIALIDFGIPGEEINRKKQLLSLMREYVEVYEGRFHPESFTRRMFEFYVPELVQSLQIVSEGTGTDVKEKIDSSITEIVNEILKTDRYHDDAQRFLDNFQLQKLFTDVINSNNRFSVTADIDSATFIRSTLMFMSLLKRLGLGVEQVRKAYIRVIREQEQKLAEPHASVSAASLDTSYHYVSNWLEKLRYSDPISYAKISEAIA